MILGCICARGGSRGVPGKNLRHLAGHPLIYYAIRSAEESTSLDDIAVSSDSSEILDTAMKYGVSNIFQRSESLSNDTASKWLVWRDLVEQYEATVEMTVDYIVDLDVTAPLRRPYHIDACVDEATSNQREVVITCYVSDRNPYFNMMEKDTDGRWKIVVSSPKSIVNRQKAPTVYSLSSAVYVVSRSALYLHSHWSNADCSLVQIDREYATDIDSEYDFRFIEFLVEKNLVELVA